MIQTVPSSTGFAYSTRLFFRILAVVHAIAFASFGWQWRGLIGPHGLLPATRFLSYFHEQLGRTAYFEIPTLCWIFGADPFVPILCGIGLALSAALFVGLAPALCLILLWISYLSLISVGQIFYGFQWDALLLEVTLLAIPLAPWSLRTRWQLIEPPRLARWLQWWLLARLMFLSGAVKLNSGDLTWRNLMALSFHFETQPLPTPVAWYVHQLPAEVLRVICAAMFTIELVAPLCLFGPRILRHGAALSLFALQILIALTGNYTFFNLLTMALCLLCLDDAWWQRVLHRVPSIPVAARRVPAWGLGLFSALVLIVTVPSALRSLGVRTSSLPALDRLLDAVQPFRSLNNYGLFAVMTHPRPELIFEGSNDDRTWLPYEFPHKPGELGRRPDFIAPFQPRLDWQLWFAALDSPENNRWVINLCEHLLHGTPEVLALLNKNPFPANPPRYIRVIRYEYHFTDASERAQSGHWWRRVRLDDYVPASSLN
jgi:hypothetical protein